MCLWLAALAALARPLGHQSGGVINPVALLPPGASCGRGVRPRRIWIGALASISIWAESTGIAYFRRPSSKNMRKQPVSPRPKKDTA